MFNVLRVGAWLQNGVLTTLWLCLCSMATASEVLTAVISRESSDFTSETASMTAGRDGYVYLTALGDPGRVLRVSPDGSNRLVGSVVYSLSGATANHEGTIATANTHFAHAVNLYSPTFEHLASCNEFAAEPSFTNPGEVRAGASGDFYALDVHKRAIVRLSPEGRIVEVFSLKPVSSGQVDPRSFTVNEANRTFSVLYSDGSLEVTGFDGQLHWSKVLSAQAHASDDEGNVYYANDIDKVFRLSSDGAELPPLVIEEESTDDDIRGGHVTAIDYRDGRIFLKRIHPVELFRVVNVNDGMTVNIVRSQHELMRVELPGLLWTAGDRVPFSINLKGNTNAGPFWQVRIARLGDSEWIDLPLVDGTVQVPANAAGLYQLKVSNGLNASAVTEYTIRAAVEIRAPKSRGTLSVWTPQNRIGHARGEEVRLTCLLRAPEAVDARLVLRGRDGFEKEISRWASEPGKAYTVCLPSELTNSLAPGRYEVIPVAEGVTGVPQPLRLGTSDAKFSTFRNTIYADYENSNIMAQFWEFPDEAERLFQETRSLGINQYVNRIFAARYPLAFANTPEGLGLQSALQARLREDPLATAPEKAFFGFPQYHVMGLFGAAGIREMLLLLSMDAGLPIGTLWSSRTLEEWGQDIRNYSKALVGLPAFHGWCWVANWWMDEQTVLGSDKQAFQSAVNRAWETGAWDPILDSVGDRKLNLQVDAQAFFNAALREVAPQASTASSGPFRRPEVYPPLSFSNVDEVDLHYQAEQITSPGWTAMAPDFYKRPGKPAWMHPEVWNDSGTGEHIGSLAWPAVMRGATGFGSSGPVPYLKETQEDSRSGYLGSASYFATLNHWLLQYGPWLNVLDNHDQVAIPVCKRQIKIDSFSRPGSIGGLYFSRLNEGFQSFLYSGYPATFVYPEDEPDLRNIKAMVVVSQEVAPSEEFLALLGRAEKNGIPIFIDGTTRKALFPSAKPLGVRFKRTDRLKGVNSDHAFWDFPQAWLSNAQAIRENMAPHLGSPIASADHPEVLFTERIREDVRLIWVANQAHHPLDAGLLWRVSNAISARIPVLASVNFSLKKGEVVYDLMSRRIVDNLSVDSPSRSIFLAPGQARAYAILPKPIIALHLEAPEMIAPGEKISFKVSVPGISGPLPVRLRLCSDGEVLEERLTTTGSGEMEVPANVKGDLRLDAVELISGKSASTSRGIQVQAGELLRFDLPRLRDVAVSPDGSTALINAFNWGVNYYRIDLSQGTLLGHGRVGDYFSYAPIATKKGFFLQGYNLRSAEGYQLHALGESLGSLRRFGLPAIPARMTPWAFPGDMKFPINQFVASSDGQWVAGGGNLAVAVWNTGGRLLWAIDWSKTERKLVRLIALDDSTLVVADGTRVSAYPVDASGEESQAPNPLWEVELPGIDPILGLVSSIDDSSVAVWNETDGGRIFVIREGKVTAAIPSPCEDLVLSARNLCVANQLVFKAYRVTGEPLWTYQADSRVLFPAMSRDGKYAAMCTQLGTLQVFDLSSDHPSPPITAASQSGLVVPAWLPNNDLLAVGWMGQVSRYSPSGALRWRSVVEDATRDSPYLSVLSEDSSPLFRYEGWRTDSEKTIQSGDNLLKADQVLVTARLAPTSIEFLNNPRLLFDGSPSSPPKPWIKKSDLGYVNSGWREDFSLEIDTFRDLLSIDAITIYEDPEHPESWLRDVRLEAWDPNDRKWKFTQYLSADAAVHSHRLSKPIQTSRIRLAAPHLEGWPAGNLRMGEIVLHGQRIGPSHPDIAAKRAVATLFDEHPIFGDTPLQQGVGSYERGGAPSGGTWLRTEGPPLGPPYIPQFGHSIPDWDFTIKDNPEPGEYRYLKFFVRALSPSTSAVEMALGSNQAKVEITVPKVLSDGGSQTVTGPLTDEWQSHIVDLWEARPDSLKGVDFRIREIHFQSRGGAAGIDGIQLGRTREDLQ